MKAVLSVAFAQLSGSAGGVTASSARGVKYLRSRVTPANPNTVAQQTQRAYFAMVVGWYQILEAQVKAQLITLADGLPKSGFNLFTARNVQDLAELPTQVNPRILPLNAPESPISSLVATTGLGSSLIKLEWLQGAATTGHKLYVLAAPMTVDAYDGPLILIQKDTTLVQTEIEGFSMPEAEKKYMMFVLVENTAASTFSIAVADSATSSVA